MAVRTEDWDASDFYVAFRDAAKTAKDDRFREKFNALADAIEPLQREFEKETVRCGKGTASLLEDLQWIAAKMGYCSAPRGFEKECEELYDRLGQAIGKVESLRGSCFA